MVRDNTILNGSEWSGPTRIAKQTCVCLYIPVCLYTDHVSQEKGMERVMDL